MSDFGRAMLAHFPLEPGGVYLNHGTVGVTPLVVMRARAALLDEIERHPARFMIRELMNLGLTPPPEAPRLRAAAAQVAAFLGVDGDGLAFVDNATSGINAVLRSFAWQPGDEMLIHDQAYGGVAPRRRLHRPRARRDGRDRRAAVSGARSGGVRSRLRRRDHAAHPAGVARSRRLRDRAGPAARRDGGGVPRARRRGARRRCPCAGGDRARHRRARRRLVRGEPAQVGVRAAQLRRSLGRARSARGASSGRDLVGRDQRRLAAGVRLARDARSVALACRARRTRLHARSARRRCHARAQPPPRLAERPAPGGALEAAVDDARIDGRLHGERAAAGALRPPTSRPPRACAMPCCSSMASSAP